MGGNNPLIVTEVANIDAAVHDIIQSAFISAGQRCTCARRLYLPQGAQGDAILARLLEVTAKLKVGLYDDEDQPFIGAMISNKVALGMLAVEKQLVELGGNVLLPMQLLAEGTALLTPGIIECTKAAALPDEEHFGPLLKVFRFNDFDDAIRQANNTSFGLSLVYCQITKLYISVFSVGSELVLSTGTVLSPVPAQPRHLVVLAVVVITEPAPITRRIIVLIRSLRWNYRCWSYRHSYHPV